MKRRLNACMLCFCLILSSFPITVNAQETNTDNVNANLGFIAGYEIAENGTVTRLTREEGKFLSPRGHGFAAEEANNLYDRLSGKKAFVVGDNNAKNGEDRKIINRKGANILIQDKYYNSAKGSIEACFENDQFRYVDANGKPMQIEVAKDQYAEAVELMKGKIKEGKIPGVTDVNEAETLVRKGKVTYQQAVNITKAGNIDSLKYDAVNGVISATCAVGISFLIGYALCKMNGLNNQEALRTASVDSFKTGGVVFASSVIAGQLSKEGTCNALKVSMEKLTKTLGKNFAEGLAKACGKNITGDAAIKYAAKILKNGALMTAITLGILEIKDISDIIQGRISKEQFLKNLSIALVSLLGGGLGALGGGAVAGTIVAPGAGTAIGALLGSLAGASIGGAVTSGIVSHFIKDDAEEMFAIIETEFQKLGEEYMLNQNEAAMVAEQLQKSLDNDKLKDMFESEERNQFARNLLEPLFEKQVAQRSKIEVASAEEVRWQLKDSLKGIVFVN